MDFHYLNDHPSVQHSTKNKKVYKSIFKEKENNESSNDNNNNNNNRYKTEPLNSTPKFSIKIPDKSPNNKVYSYKSIFDKKEDFFNVDDEKPREKPQEHFESISYINKTEENINPRLSENITNNLLFKDKHFKKVQKRNYNKIEEKKDSLKNLNESNSSSSESVEEELSMRRQRGHSVNPQNMYVSPLIEKENISLKDKLLDLKEALSKIDYL